MASAEILCRDCFAWSPGTPARCPACGSRRVLCHPELRDLSIAHLDCDAFYASVEKRDDPSLLDKPVVVGGRQRGVVSAACYVARVYGVRSAMPMFKALAACPHAVVIKPDMKKYAAVGAEIREMMRSITPQVEPLSIDEAFMDLSGTERLHQAPPAETLVRLAKRVEETVRVTVSIGLSFNKFLAKVSSDLDKPRGFHVIGQGEAVAFLAEQPVSILWGVGKALQRKLIDDGIRTISDLQPFEEVELMRRYGSIGQRLARFSRGRDDRRIEPGSVVKSVSNETTFDTDIADVEALRPYLWRLSEEVSGRLKRKAIAGGVVTLKLKTRDFKILTRQQHLMSPTQLTDRIYRTADALLTKQADGRQFRLIGVGVSDLAGEHLADPVDLADPEFETRRKIESAMDAVRAKLGNAAITKGIGLKARKIRQQPSDKPPDDQEF
ncbi:MAG: DNA polymerase IV [Thalassobaculaceae bacterium]|nr:DNA polymerase IV [Thalassobaculaceae bacterium]